jgi:hypothetical protein
VDELDKAARKELRSVYVMTAAREGSEDSAIDAPAITVERMALWNCMIITYLFTLQQQQAG